MPILECYGIPVFKPADQAGQPPITVGTLPQWLVTTGPTVNVEVGFDPALFGVPSAPPGVSVDPTAASTPAPAAPPQIRQVKALVDTGASTSCIDEDLAQSLGLPLINKVPVGGVGGSQELCVYLCRLLIPQISFSKAGAFIGARLSHGRQQHQALIGRDFLTSMVLVYDGVRGTVKLAV